MIGIMQSEGTGRRARAQPRSARCAPCARSRPRPDSRPRSLALARLAPRPARQHERDEDGRGAADGEGGGVGRRLRPFGAAAGVQVVLDLLEVEGVAGEGCWGGRRRQAHSKPPPRARLPRGAARGVRGREQQPGRPGGPGQLAQGTRTFWQAARKALEPASMDEMSSAAGANSSAAACATAARHRLMTCGGRSRGVGGFAGSG
jgi:hypothetical protein